MHYDNFSQEKELTDRRTAEICFPKRYSGNVKGGIFSEKVFNKTSQRQEVRETKRTKGITSFKTHF